MITIYLFGHLFDLVGKRSADITAFPSGGTHFAPRDLALKGVGIGKRPVLKSVNKQVTRNDTPVKEVDELALFSLLSGG